MPVGQDHVVIQELGQRQIGRIAAVAMDENESRFRLELHQLHEVADLDAFPTVVEARPGGDAMEIRDLSGTRQLLKLFPVEQQRIFDQADHAEVPFCRIKTRRRTVAQYWKVGNESLAGGQTIAEIFFCARLCHKSEK